MDIADIAQIAVVAAASLVGFYFGAKAAIVKIGTIIPGDDPFERFGKMLEEKVDPVADMVASGIDKLNPLTHGGAGNSDPEEAAPPPRE